MTEALTTTSAEVLSQPTIDRQLRAASDRVVDQMYEPAFHTLLVESGVDIASPDPALYWEKMAQYTSQQARAESLSPLERDALLLTGYLPNAVFAQYQLKHGKGSLTRGEERNLKRTACVYNGLLKDFVQTHPQSPEHLQSSLVESALQTVGGDSYEFSAFMEESIASTLKGVKHEIGFAAVLDTINIAYRHATISEDLKGWDLVVNLYGQDIGVDVKASLDQVDAKNHGADGPIAIKPNGDLVVFSMLTESKFHDSFLPDQNYLDSIEDTYGDTFREALVKALAKK